MRWDSNLTPQKYCIQPKPISCSPLSQPCKVATSHLRITWFPGSPNSVLLNAYSQSWHTAELDRLSYISSVPTRYLDQHEEFAFFCDPA